MAELNVRLELRVTPRLARFGIAAGLMLVGAGELASESVTLTTYYPAPSGVYSQMITTDSTWLARDANAVIIGSAGAAAGQKLDIFSNMGGGGNAAIRATYPAGGGLLNTEFSALAHRNGVWQALYASQGAASYAAYMNGTSVLNGATTVNGTLTVNGAAITGQYALTPSYAAWAGYGTGSGGAAIYNDGGPTYYKLMIVGNNSAGGSREIGMWDNVTINGNETTSGKIDNSGGIISRHYAGCVFTTYGAGTVNCAAGKYATLTSGVMSKYQIINDTTDGGSVYTWQNNPNGVMLCCNCPGGSCPSF